MVDGCIATAKTVDTAIKRIKEALEFHLEGEFLTKYRKKNVNTILKHVFEDYGTDALYDRSMKLAVDKDDYMPHPIVDKLADLRRRVRLLVIVRGLSAILSACLGRRFFWDLRIMFCGFKIAACG